jgi:flagellar basal-body rod modification protein FlgD
MTVSTSVLDSLNGAASTGTVKTANDAGSADRFLKLLVAQMQNQDPLSPMDNAQVTSQMAQINTVSGIEKLNQTVQGLNGQFVQMQALQGATLVGRDVIVPGNQLSIADGAAQGGFDLAGPADAVKVEILGPSGQVIDTINVGAQSSGLHSFDWPAGSATDASKEGFAGSASGLRFRVTATSGATSVTSTALMRDRIDAVATGGDSLTLELARSGSVPYASVKAFN